MAINSLDKFINFIIPIILILIVIIFIWWKFSEPLKKFGGLIAGMFHTSKDRTFEKIQGTKDIIYDI